ncbi:Homeodomain-like domain-containing protein [Nocardioides sp. YR527]|uniref:helix-turn-helix domain-containing protein n=1 Tax=Nocardioides sp. YR527 TaxID=1881028 RepID=UPI000888B307|nr:helix-turn-helix domain-containing protein [Nocardioides sp. YR527]SDK11723.1 Homeodomain-like domain-containing protein [Nocardioides sp. YR527]
MRPDNGTTPSTGKGPTGNGRGLILFGAVSVALISTAAAYVAMVGFGRDVLAMGAINAYAFAGVFELSLVTVALMAREAAQQDRPAQTLLTLTWLLSAASGFFAGWHEIHLGHAATAAAFRFIVPLLAALMWHLALVGDRHLAMERSWSDLRMGARMHALLATRVEWRRARDTAVRKRTASSRRKLERAQKRYWRAEAVALRSVAPGAMRDQITQWVDAFAAVAEGTRQADRLPITLPDVHEALSVPVVEQVPHVTSAPGADRAIEAPTGIHFDRTTDAVSDSVTDVPREVTPARETRTREMASALATPDTRRRVSSRVSDAARTAADAAPGAGMAPQFSNVRTATKPSDSDGALLDRIPFPENIPDPEPAMDYPDILPDEIAELMANLPDDKAEASRLLVDAGARIPDVAAQLGVSTSSVYRWTRARA